MLKGNPCTGLYTNAAGPAAGGLIADYGAEVIKIERPVTATTAVPFPDCRRQQPLPVLVQPGARTR
jgi:crotonobetainyl-CoA:carnitine CoA-transferase CaiB-like acyl-CoA transferase